MTDIERELDLALGEAQAEIAKLRAEKDRLYLLVSDMAHRLLAIRDLTSMAKLADT
jgi:hypothetical protein